MRLLAAVLISFIAVRGFRFELTGEGFALVNTLRFSWLLLFLFFLWILDRSAKETDRRLKAYSIAFGLIISAFYTIGLGFEKLGCLSWIWKSKGYLINYLNRFFSYVMLYYCFAFTAFQLLRDHSGRLADRQKPVFSFRRILLFWALLVICYLPWYFYCYPGILSPDSGDQVRQALGITPLNNHHPVLSALLIRAVMRPVYSLTGSYQTGVGVYTALQMLFVTFIFALAYDRVRMYLRSGVLRLIVFLWFAFFPVNSINSITMWKDIPFSILILALMLCIDDILTNEAPFFCSRRKCLLLFFCLLLLPLFRHNGLMITVIMSVWLLFQFRAYFRKILIVCGGALMLYAAWNMVLIPSMHITNVKSNLMLSVLEQQIARTLSSHHADLASEDLAVLEKYFDIPQIWEKYNPIVSDPVKEHFNDDLFDRDPAGFLKLWLKLGLKYPVEYIEAFLHNNYGYWFPETSYYITSFGIFTFGQIEDIRSEPLPAPAVMDKIYQWYNDAEYEKTPLLPLLFKPGACWWLWIFCGLYCLYRNRRKFILFVPGFMLWLTVLASPVFCEFRYVYALFIGLPLLMGSVLGSRDRIKG